MTTGHTTVELRTNGNARRREADWFVLDHLKIPESPCGAITISLQHRCLRKSNDRAEEGTKLETRAKKTTN